MRIWRLTIAAAIFLIIALPLLLPLAELLQTPAQSWHPDDLSRFLSLSRNTVQLAAGTVVLSLPVGILLAIFLFRTDVPGRRFFALLVFVSLFLPLPLLTSTWHTVFSGENVLTARFWVPRPGQPWPQGILPAIWVHAMASIPWVTLLAGLGVCRAEKALEEQALLSTGPIAVMWHITLRRAWPAILLAAIWVTVSTVGEISVTDMFLVRTYAEEVYLLFSQDDEQAVPKAVLLSVPFSALVWTAVIVCGMRLWSSVHDNPWLVAQHRFSLGRWRLCTAGFVGIIVFLLSGIPVLTMIWATGYQSVTVGWSLTYFADGIAKAIQISLDVVAFSLLGTVLISLLTNVLAWLACWNVAQVDRASPFWRLALLSLVALAWVQSGPIVGMGLKQLIQLLVNYLELPWLNFLLYYGPSFVPTWWAWMIRTFPFAVIFLWPSIRSLPNSVIDSAQLQGATYFGTITRIAFPLTFRAFSWSSILVMAMMLNEMGASKHVATPGTATFSQELFQRMHSGVQQDVAGLCLLLLLILGVAASEGAIRSFAIQRFSKL